MATISGEASTHYSPHSITTSPTTGKSNELGHHGKKNNGCHWHQNHSRTHPRSPPIHGTPWKNSLKETMVATGTEITQRPDQLQYKNPSILCGDCIPPFVIFKYRSCFMTGFQMLCPFRAVYSCHQNVIYPRPLIRRCFFQLQSNITGSRKPNIFAF